MEIIVGKTSGFCNGVKFTIDKANEMINKYKKIYCLGQIVHNERVIKDLENKGMITINNIDDCPNNSRLIIRAHGEVKDVYDEAKKRNIELIDLTCGKIKIIRNKINKKINNHFIIIIGKKNHPETLGIQSFSGTNSFILENETDIDLCIDKIQKSKLRNIYIVSQTTFNSEKFDYLVNKISSKVKIKIEIDKTICNATSNRQKETKDLSKKVDIMIIVGGKNSSNTKELEVISTKNSGKVYLIQDYRDLKKIKIDYKCKIGIMAGASTPDVVVEEIINYLEGENMKELYNQIKNYKPVTEKEKADKEVILNFMKNNDNCLLRDNKIAHFTASGWIVNKQRDKVLMIYHNIYDSWAWVGGHADGDSDLLHVAKKEIEEETGVTKLKQLYDGIYGINIVTVEAHKKRGKQVNAHLHFDLEFLFEADENDKLTIKEDENSNVGWIPVEEVNNYTTEEKMKPIYKCLNDKLKKIK